MMNQTQKILQHYRAETPGVRQNIARVLSHGALGHTGRMIVYSIDQGFELGPDTSFGVFSHGYDPWFHFKLALACKVNALAAPLGLLEVCVDQFIGKIPLILKLNSNNKLSPQSAPYQAITASVDDALRLGCSGVGFTIYPGSADAHQMYEDFAILAREAKQRGLFVMAWAYPRIKDKERDLDAIAYAAHIACQLGAHIIKVKFPDVPEEASPLDYVRHIQRCAFSGKRLVLFSGGERQEDEAAFLQQVSDVARGGAAGSMIGRNLFQRSFPAALALCEKIANIYKSNTQKHEIYED